MQLENQEGNKKNSICRNNHYVPQMYLQQWGTDNKIYEYKMLVPHKKVPVWIRSSISSTASMPNLYVRGFKGDEYDDFEIDFNRRFETPAAEPLLKLIHGDRMSVSDWDKICDFVTLQFVRTPAFYIKNQKNNSALFEKELIDLSQHSIEQAPLPSHDSSSLNKHLLPLSIEITGERADDNHTMAKVTTIVGKSIWLAEIEHALMDGSIVRTTMRNLHWSVVSSHQDVVWPTTDDPFVFYNPQGRNLFNVGFNTPGSIFVFPISPNKALIAKSKGRFPSRFTATKEDALKIKRLISENALLSIFSSTEDPEIEKLRPRTVDESEFKRIQKETRAWYDLYWEEEVPLLK